MVTSEYNNSKDLKYMSLLTVKLQMSGLEGSVLNIK